MDHAIGMTRGDGLMRPHRIGVRAIFAASRADTALQLYFRGRATVSTPYPSHLLYSDRLVVMLVVPTDPTVRRRNLGLAD
jgi:hypothetical protein